MAVGRFKNGTPLATQGAPKAGYDPRSDEDFDYAHDAAGDRCPLHSHIRKVNPRGSLGFLVNLLAREQRRRIRRMIQDVNQAGGGVLVVPQFTLVADTRKGNRPSLGRAAEPTAGEALFDLLVTELRSRCSEVATGRFGADMDVELVNRGPVTFWLEVPPDAGS